MRVIAINGSPRKNANTTSLLNAALDGAASAGVETKLYHLYDYSFTGCQSCFACKIKGPSFDDIVCAVKDDLRPILEDSITSDVLLLGAPIYFGHCSAMMLAYLERLLFAITTYDNEMPTKPCGPVNSAFFYTMNGDDERVKKSMLPLFDSNERLLSRLGGTCITYAATDTMQFTDYSRYHASRIDAAAKVSRHETQFKIDLANAREIGIKLAASK